MRTQGILLVKETVVTLSVRPAEGENYFFSFTLLAAD